MSINTQFCDACSALDIDDAISTVAPLINVLDDLSKGLARDPQLRQMMGDGDPRLWPSLHTLWGTTASAHSRDYEGDEQMYLRKLCLSVARFTRNLVASVPSNQTRAFKNEPVIRALVRHYTSFVVLEDKDALPVAGMLIQTLSNLITANDRLTQELWNTYMDSSMEELILIRLLGVPDTQTVTSTLVFILNCVNASRAEAERLTNSRSGPRLCISLLDRIAVLFDADESSESGRAFEIGYTIFSRLTEEGLVPDLYHGISVYGEVVTPHQTILLKLLDSFLHSSQALHRMGLPQIQSLCDMLLSIFFSLSAYAQQAINRSLGSNNTRISLPVIKKIAHDGHNVSPSNANVIQDPPNPCARTPDLETPLQEVDMLLPKVCEALVLVTQCFISLTLRSEERVAESGRNNPGTTPKQAITHEDELKELVSNALSPGGGEGFVERLIGTLRLLDLFLPRITFGKVAPSPVLVGQKQACSQNSTVSGEPQGHNSPTAQAPDDPRGFAYLKRDLVRLLGILSYHSRAVQDRVRACSGIPVVLNLCVVDDRNPYLREHAIFTLRNLLYGNLENQAMVDEIQPLREWDENGVLQENIEGSRG